MMPIGSEVIYSGEKWINAVKGTQPVWGLQKSKAKDVENRTNNDEDRATYLQIITSKFPDASDEVKAKAKELLADSGCKKFTEEAVPIDTLKEISELF